MTDDAPAYAFSLSGPTGCAMTPQSLSFYGGGDPIITLYTDGRVELADSVSPDAAARHVCALIIKHFGAMLNERIAELERENAALRAKLAEGAWRP